MNKFTFTAIVVTVAGLYSISGYASTTVTINQPQPSQPQTQYVVPAPVIVAPNTNHSVDPDFGKNVGVPINNGGDGVWHQSQ